MELKPFGVDAIVVAPGSIKSNFGEVAKSTISLPTDSLYTKFKRSIEARASASQGPNATPTAVFAKNVVNVVLKPKSPSYFTFGHFASLFLLFYHFPRWITDIVLAKAMGVKAVEDKPSKRD